MIQNYEKLLTHSIPVVNDMDISIDKLTKTEVILKAPLKKNINYEGSVFGGSLNTVATLSGYLLTRYNLETENIPFTSLVIQSSQIQYLTPVKEDFFARADIKEGQIEKFIQMLSRKGLGRIDVRVEIFSSSSEKVCALFSGRFVTKTH